VGYAGVMRSHVWVGIALAALTGTAAAGRCLSFQDAVATQKRVNADNEASLARKLAKRKLKPVKLVRHTPIVGDSGAPGAGVDTVTTLGGVQVVNAGPESTCGAQVDAAFVQRDNEIFRLVRGPIWTPAPIKACECYFEGYACGGAYHPPMSGRYDLPAGTTYGGPVTVEFDARDSTILGGVAPRKPCVRPPPPP
jgi:hypothetical protein